MRRYMEIVARDGGRHSAGLIRPTSWQYFPPDDRHWYRKGGLRIYHEPFSVNADADRPGLQSWWKRIKASFTREDSCVPLPTAKDSSTDLFPIIREAVGILRGRMLSEEQVVQELRRRGFWPAVVDAALDYGSMYQYWLSGPGIGEHSLPIKECRRCGSHNTSVLPCPHCGRDECHTCLECQTMGMIRECTRMLWLEDASQCPQPVAVQLAFPLTQAQTEASEFLIEFLAQPDKRKALVWAACGAGKTETVFGAMETVLRRGGRVLFAIPRRDVVVELEDRLRTAFPQTSTLVLYGGKPWQGQARLVAATTHQVLRFYHAFDLVILDEVDAYPYHGSEMLRFGLQRALKPAGKWIEMTATPMHWPVRQPSVTIPARHHGHPLPMPEFVAWPKGNVWGQSKFILPERIMEALHDSKSWLVFVPTRDLCQPLAAWLQNKFGRRWKYCHSQSAHRQQALQELRQGGLTGVVTTTVLERGITIADVQVIVLWADHSVFSAGSLVQIAGRVGRHKDFAAGHVFFAAAKSSESINESLRRVGQLNQQAHERGLLRNMG